MGWIVCEHYNLLVQKWRGTGSWILFRIEFDIGNAGYAPDSGLRWRVRFLKIANSIWPSTRI